MEEHTIRVLEVMETQVHLDLTYQVTAVTEQIEIISTLVELELTDQVEI